MSEKKSRSQTSVASKCGVQGESVGLTLFLLRSVVCAGIGGSLMPPFFLLRVAQALSGYLEYSAIVVAT